MSDQESDGVHIKRGDVPKIREEHKKAARNSTVSDTPPPAKSKLCAGSIEMLKQVLG